jgi:hypothetical protein
MSLFISQALSEIISKLPFSEHFRSQRYFAVGDKDKPDINYLDIKIEDKSVFLTFLDSKRVKECNGDYYTTHLRQQSKVGRALVKLFPKVPFEEIRAFVEELQATLTVDGVLMRIVEGAEVVKYYMIPKKDCISGNHGAFRNSCYQGIALESNFDLMVKNPDRVKLAIILEDDKLAGRALLHIGNVYKKEGTYLHVDGYYCASYKYQVKLTSFVGEFAKTHNMKVHRHNDGEFYVNDMVKGTPLHHYSSIGYNKDRGAMSTNFDTWSYPSSVKWYTGASYF